MKSIEYGKWYYYSSGLDETLIFTLRQSQKPDISSVIINLKNNNIRIAAMNPNEIGEMHGSDIPLDKIKQGLIIMKSKRYNIFIQVFEKTIKDEYI